MNISATYVFEVYVDWCKNYIDLAVFNVDKED